MRRGAKPAKAKVKTKPPIAHKAQKSERARVQDLEKHLAEAQKREAEALEQQTVTSEILRVISASPTDAQPVFEAIARNAARLCGAMLSGVFSFDGTRLHFVAGYQLNEEASRLLQEQYPLVPRGLNRLALVERAVVHSPDVLNDARVANLELIRRLGYRSHLVVPMVQAGHAVGVINIYRAQPTPFSEGQIALLKTFADQAVIAIENVRLFTELEARNKDLTNALQRETATGEILRLISRSPTDVTPVFEGILRSALRLAAANHGAMLILDGEFLHLATSHGTTREWHDIAQRVYPIRVDADSASGQAILERRAVFIEDAQNSQVGRVRDLAHTMGYRSLLMVPMLRQDAAVGVIALVWQDAQVLPSEQLPLLQTFADQAVIAIENVRLFTELQEKNLVITEAHAQVTEALEQQTATNDILRVISSSPTDIEPVLEAVAKSAARFCGADDAVILQLDGEHLRAAAHQGPIPVDFSVSVPCVLGTVGGRTVLERRAIHVTDLQAEVQEFPEGSALAKRFGHRTTLGVPLLREGTAVGTIQLRRREANRFTDKQTALLQTFADQAVIAIENVRLFTELQARNKELIEALDKQTATSEMLRVILSSPTDPQPVFDTIARSAARLCDAPVSGVARFDGQVLEVAATHGYGPEALEFLLQRFPRRAGRETGWGRAVLERHAIHLHDVTVDAEYEGFSTGYRTLLAVPMLGKGTALGAIAIWRREVRPFSDQQIALVETFADQAVIAIENVRLFKELEARTQDLTRSVGELRALGEVGQAISSTLDLRTVLSTIVTRATQLSGTDAGVIYEYNEQREVFLPRASEHLEAEIVETMLATPVRKGEGATGQLAVVQEPVQLSDILAAPAESRVRGALVRAGYRALLAVPLVREDHLLGGLTVIRKATGEFTPEVIELLRTFATQSALAIQNARLFREIADKSAQLEAASRHKSEFLANMSHELRTPLNAIIGFSEILAEKMFGDINEKQTEYLQDILESGRHLLSLINDILDLSKIEAGRMELELSEFDLPKAIENALILVRERASRRGIRLGSTIDPRLGTIGADERKVKQVLLNLLSNALKFTPEGGRIDVGARLGGEMTEVSVRDTGIGIAPEDRAAVFEEFRQVGTADKKAEGTGLGLALSRKFIELHGGRIWVESQLGAGSTFSFTLPVRRDG
jgi:signal transduction histidine kinase/putative methionine-R-sulfoxide reductase with GAF domain